MPKELSREELLDKIEETAHNYEKEYHGCTRSALLSLQEHLNLGDELTFQSSSPLCSAALSGGICGAMLAGLLALGLVTCTRKMEKDFATISGPIIAGSKLLRKFQKEFGTTFCSDIRAAKLGQSFNMLDPEGYKGAEEAGLYEECSKTVGKVARLAAEFILDMQEKEKAAKQ